MGGALELMANNRMQLVCTTCRAENEPLDVVRFPLWKYYPSQGWYINRDAEGIARFGDDVNRWLDQHIHGSMWGTDIIVEYETAPKEVEAQ